MLKGKVELKMCFSMFGCILNPSSKPQIILSKSTLNRFVDSRDMRQSTRCTIQEIGQARINTDTKEQDMNESIIILLEDARVAH